MKPPFLHRKGPNTGRTPSGKSDRGLVTQLDFLTSMVIRIVTFSILLAAATALVHSAVGTDPSNQVVAQRGASRLADDLLVTGPGDAILNATCTEEFFKASTDTCGFDPEWTASGTYLNGALSIDPGKRMNVTVTSSPGTVVSIGETPLTMGEPPPTDYGTVHTWHRQVGLDTDGDGTVQWVTVTVAVWE